VFHCTKGPQKEKKGKREGDALQKKSRERLAIVIRPRKVPVLYEAKLHGAQRTKHHVAKGKTLGEGENSGILPNLLLTNNDL